MCPCLYHAEALYSFDEIVVVFTAHADDDTGDVIIVEDQSAVESRRSLRSPRGPLVQS